MALSSGGPGQLRCADMWPFWPATCVPSCIAFMKPCTFFALDLELEPAFGALVAHQPAAAALGLNAGCVIVNWFSVMPAVPRAKFRLDVAELAAFE